MDERRKQLHRDMNSYLAHRPRDSWPSKKEQPALHPIVHPYKKEEPMEQSPMEQEYDKKGWFSGFMNKLFGEDSDATESVVTNAPLVSDASADLKELARISIGVMKKMPGDLVRDFKESPDYETFKSILRKHNLGK